MILDHVPQCPGPLIIAGPVLNAQLLTGSDLDVIDVALVPEMLEKRVSETQDHDVLSRFLAQKMVDPESGRFVKTFVDRIVQVLSRGEISPERLFHDHPGPASGGGFRQPRALEVGKNIFKLIGTGG